MLRNILLISGLLTMMGCTSNQTEAIKSSSRHDSNKVGKAYNNKTILSYVRAYLLIGNIEKAEEHFGTLKTPELIPGAILAQAELQAAKGNSVDAQQTFLLALTDSLFVEPLNKKEVTANLLDFFCSEHKWPALEGYASALIDSNDDHSQHPIPSDIQLKNNALTKIGLCFFEGQQLEQAQKWLRQLDMTQQIDPQAHLALARIAVQKNQLSVAQESINQYETTKTKIDAKMLWTAFEVYQALNQSEIAVQTGDNLYSLFPNNEYTRKYILTKKREERIKRKQQETVDLLETINSSPEKNLSSPTPAPAYEQSIHIMKKGETLYQLTKRYDVLIADLLRWNPDLVANNIPLGAKIRLFAD